MTVQVVYIAGQAFSGSTFFCAMLGVHPQMEPLSELAMWTLNGWRLNRVCSCGKRTRECPYWSVVHARWLEGLQGISLPEYIALQKRVETISYTWPRTLMRMPWSRQDMQAYAAPTVLLFQTASQVSGRPIIVDSSKKPGRAAALSMLDGLDLRIIHLVRNGLNFIDSSIRRRKLAVGDPRFLYRVFRLGLNWSTSNYAAERTLHLNGSKGIRLRFEDLVRDPISALGEVSTGIGIDLASIQEHLRLGQPITFRHMSSGSPHREGGPTRLKPELARPISFDRRVRLAFYLGAGWLSRRYGYL